MSAAKAISLVLNRKIVDIKSDWTVGPTCKVSLRITPVEVGAEASDFSERGRRASRLEHRMVWNVTCLWRRRLNRKLHMPQGKIFRHKIFILSAQGRVLG